MANTSVFVSYSHRDRHWVDAFRAHLAPLIRENRLKFWDDVSELRPGDDWRYEIESALGTARAAILLISPSFLESTFIRNNELPVIFESARNKNLRILWALVSRTDIRASEIERYQSLSGGMNPLDDLPKKDAELALAKMAIEVASLVTLESIGSGLEIIDEVYPQFQAVRASQPEEGSRSFAHSGIYGSDVLFRYPDGSFLFEKISVDEFANLDPDARELIEVIVDNMQQNYKRWLRVYPTRSSASGILDEEVEAELRRVARPMCEELRRLIRFLESIGKQLDDHYHSIRFICQELSAPN